MTKKIQKQNAKNKIDEMVQVDAFFIPAHQAEMYTTLREAVANEALEYWRAKYPQVHRINDDPDEGEAIQVRDANDQELFRFYLNPFNISQAQKARDKDQLAKFLVKFEEES
ncbi:hypothetical protein [Facklamia miroungae]|uniref:Uncharacterized protein n=1 Tax=Facklamia miroungae TaxID=120956 RepID=A0A1G7T6K8_9LACT|nr:hypothetical protein [Facklamia miroungae]NKZ29689.1 hypothetical protein [Facklamia miroungae]SDG31007.1 hypothetical protein SAMN05421791_10517 [Facklamia miroungae]